MLDVAPTELLLVAVVALVVIGPKDLPRAMRFVGQWVARARGVARHFRTGIDEMIRQAELEEMEKKWAAENARIMAEHPAQPHPTVIEGEMLPLGGLPINIDTPAIQDGPADPHDSFDPPAHSFDPPPVPSSAPEPAPPAPDKPASPPLP